MQQILNEYETCLNYDFDLHFKIPTPEELQQARRLNRERTDREKKLLTNAKASINELIASLEDGSVDSELLPELDKLMNIVQKRS